MQRLWRQLSIWIPSLILVNAVDLTTVNGSDPVPIEIPIITVPSLERDSQPSQPLQLPAPIRQEIKDDAIAPSKSEEAKWESWQPTGPELSIGDCIRIAHANQPTIRAAVASLAAAQRGYLALMHLRSAFDIFSPDLPFRRRQAQRGILAAMAEVDKTVQETTYDVCRLYYSYIYATQQEKTATEIMAQIQIFYQMAKDTLDSGLPDKKIKIDQFTLYALEKSIDKIAEMRMEASLGRKKSLYALLEAMGLDSGFAFVPKEKTLPLLSGSIDQEQIVNLALRHRPEVIQSLILVEACQLEVCAQNALKHRSSAPTFAAGTDLHSRFIPAPIRDEEYRPGAIPPEMPTTLAGKREDRVARTQAYLSRHQAMYTKIVSVIRLEAITAFLTWEDSRKRLLLAKEQYLKGIQIVEDSRKVAALQPNPEMLVKNEALAGESQSAYIKAAYMHTLAIIQLEKVTAGQIQAGFIER